MEYEKCYIFQPNDERPAKKRRLEPQGLHRTWPRRQKQFKETWRHLNVAIVDAVAAVNAANTTAIDNFLNTAHEDASTTHIPTGIVLLQPGSSSRASLLDDHKLSKLDRSQIRITLEPAAAPNLKTALKAINQAGARSIDASLNIDAIDADDDEEEEERLQVSGRRSAKNAKSRRLLAYDLQILQDLVTSSDIVSVVVHLLDTEGFDGEVLSDLVQHLSFWRDRMPIVLLVNVSTSVDMLEGRLSKTARSKLHGKLFPAATCEDEFGAIIKTLMNDNLSPILGPALIRMAKDRQHDYLQDINSIRASITYALMTAYFANPLALFLDVEQGGGRAKDVIPADHYEALRNTASFKTAVRGSLEAKDVLQAKKLLSDDKALLQFVHQHIKHGVEQTRALFRTLALIQHIQMKVPSAKESRTAFLYVAGLSGQLRGSSTLRNMFLAMRKAPVSSIEQLLDTDLTLPDTEYEPEMKSHLQQICRLIVSQQDRTSHHNTPNDQGAIVHKICRSLEAEIDRHLINPKDLLFHEVFFFDLVSPYREVFTPRPRQAIERALTTPHDYLDCDCCTPDGDNDDALNAAQPATAILYSLYKESGNLINVYDAWQAFEAVIEDEEHEQRTMALFQRGLAELKHIGMVKNTRKRVDHVAKVAWPGL